jgi:butyrate response factor 1
MFFKIVCIFGKNAKYHVLIFFPRYKTEICRNFKERSKCIYGDRCQFAHGRKELRDVVRNTKYKTKLCQKYWLVGYCAYGPRCNFLHDEATLEDRESFKMEGSRSSSPVDLMDVNSLDGLSKPNANTTAAAGIYLDFCVRKLFLKFYYKFFGYFFP